MGRKLRGRKGYKKKQVIAGRRAERAEIKRNKRVLAISLLVVFAAAALGIYNSVNGSSSSSVSTTTVATPPAGSTPSGTATTIVSGTTSPKSAQPTVPESGSASLVSTTIRTP